MDKVVAISMVVLTIVITVLVAIQNCATAAKICGLVAMLFIDGITIGGAIYTFRK